MKQILVLYFSGTGNTEYAVEKLCGYFILNGIRCKITNIEEVDTLKSILKDEDTILVAYPIYGSCMPWIMKEFLKKNSYFFKNKKLITVVTQAIASGDGGALAARLLKKENINHIASIHINMPSNLGREYDDKAIAKIAKADTEILKITNKLLAGDCIKNGRWFFISRAMGILQRFPASLYLKKLRKGLKIDKNLCIKCGKCVSVCPMKNIEFIRTNEVVAKDMCTACFRCINSCPSKAISLFSKRKPKKQYIKQ